ncbi:MAG: BrnT family toxin [Gemmatimonadales bacterium]
MGYQWDPAKARANLRKHGIDVADAVGALEDPLALILDDLHPTEGRFISVGQDFLGRIIVVNWTLRGADLRLFSARAATRTERRHYEEGHDNA